MPQQQFDPLAAYRQQYDDPRPDAEIVNKLRDPANFRKAFPNYDYSSSDADARIKNHMESYYNSKFGAAPSQSQTGGAAAVSPQGRQPMPPTDNSFKATDLIPNAIMPGLSAANKFLNTPISKQLGLGSLSEQAEKTSPTPVQGGVSGMAKDTYGIANKTAAGVGDFIQSPAGIAAAGLEALTGGAATPWLAGMYTASMAPAANDAYNKYKANPTPENMQEALTAGANLSGMAGMSGAGVREHYAPKTPDVGPQTMNGRGHYESPTPGSAAEPMQGPSRENVSNLKSKGYTNQEISNMNAQQFHDAVTGNAPVREQAPSATAAQISDVIAPTPKGPKTASDFRGGDTSVVRPWDPDGTRFKDGRTIGLDPIDAHIDRSMDKFTGQEAPSQASQGANYRPSYTYKPSEKAATMSAADIDRGPEFNAQEFQEEVNRNNSILRNPSATSSDRAIATDRLRDAQEGLARIQSGGKVVPTTPSEVRDLSTQMGGQVPQDRVQSLQGGIAQRRDSTGANAVVSSEKSPADSVSSLGTRQQTTPVVASAPPRLQPSGTESTTPGLTPSRSEAAQQSERRASTETIASPDAVRQARTAAAQQRLAALESANQTAKSNDASYRKMVEDAGGRYVGVNSMGIVDYKVDPAMVGGRTDVSVSTLSHKMSPEFVKAEINRKVGEFADKGAPSNGALVSAGEPVIKSETPNVRVGPDVMQRVLSSMSDMSRLKTKIDQAQTPEAKDRLTEDLADASARAKNAIKAHLRALDEAGLNQLLEHLSNQQVALDAQADAIRDAVDLDKKSKPIVNEMRQRMSTGGPVKTHSVPDPETGEEVSVKGKQTAEVKRGMRDLFHELVGEKPFTRPEQLVVKEPPKGTPPEEWSTFIAGMQDRRMQLRMEIARDFEIIRDTNGSIEDVAEKMQDLYETEEMIGSYPSAEQISEKPRNPRTGEKLTAKEGWVARKDTAVGRKPKLPVKFGENGEVLSQEVLPTITLAKAQAMMGKKVNKIPAHEELEARADELSENARLHGAVATAVKKVLKVRNPGDRTSEAGAVGIINEYSGPAVDKPYNPADISKETVIANANRAGLENYGVSEATPSGRKGWLSPDGTHFVDPGMYTHSDAADHMAPAVANSYSPYRALKEEGWIRKESRSHYEAQSLNQKTVNTIERDTIHGGQFSKPITLDSRGNNGPMSLEIPAGWTDLGRAIGEAKRARDRQLGGATAMGLAQMASATLGGALGYVTAGLPGGVLGFMAGAAAPVLLSSAPVKRAMRTIAPLVRSLGIPLKNWFQGTPQIDVASPRMKQVLSDQLAHANRQTAWIEKVKRLPAEVRQGFDPYVMVADRDNQTHLDRTLLQFDPRGKVFRDMRLPDTQSLYVALRTARANAMGGRGANGIQYSQIRSDANQAGLQQALTTFLNLKAYQRAHDVLGEHMQDLRMQMQNIHTKMQSPSNTPRQMQALRDDMDDAIAMHDEIADKIRNGEATPHGYTQGEITRDMQSLQQTLTPDQWIKVNQFAQRTFAVRANVLDLLHGSGIISDEAFNKYKARGDEYIPMERIMDDMADEQFNSSPSPLHLKHQTVIQQMLGSVRTNVDPWEAIAHADTRAFNQLFRNEAMNTAIQLATTYPQTIGQEFRQVSQSYQPQKGEMVVGRYKNGQQESYAVPEYLGKTLQNLPVATQHALAGFSSWAAHAFKASATVAVAAFQITSLATHATSGAILAKGSGLRASPKLPVEAAKFIRDWTRAASNVLRQSPEYIEMVRSGASFGTLRDFVDPEYNADPKSLGWTGKFRAGRYLDAAHEFASASEDINRMNTFSRARQAGMSVKEASIEARLRGGAPDFSRMGDIGKSLNMALMFLNASLQYMNQATMAVKRDWKRIGGLMIIGAAMTIANSAWNNSIMDEDGTPMIRKVSTYERERNWVVLTPWHYTTSSGSKKAIDLKVPKPAIARYMLNPIDSLYNRYLGVESRSGRQQALDAIASASPIRLNLKAHREGSSLATSVVSDLNPIAKFGIHQYSNTDDYGRPIVPTNQLEGSRAILPEYQGAGMSSPTAQTMAQGGGTGAGVGATLGGGLGFAVGGLPGLGVGAGIGGAVGASGVAPRRIDVGLNDLTAGMGKFATGILDPFMNARIQPQEKQMQGPEAARNLPVVGGIVSRFTSSPVDAEDQRAMEDFYNVVDQYGRIANTAKMLEKQDPVEYQKFVARYKDDLFRGILADKLAQKVGQISGQIHNIQDNPSYSPQAKQQMIRQLRDARKQMMSALQAPGNQPTKDAKR